jgi:DNA-binding GntR family transcriptional regulator
MRIALETLALTHALPHLSDADLVYAAKARDACDASETMAEWDRQDRLFHMALLKPCAMPRLLAAIEDLHISASRHVFSRLPERRRPRADLDHADLLAAVGREDLPEATAVLRRHLRRVG